MRLSDFKAGSGVKQTLPLPVTSPFPIEMTVVCGCRPGKTLVVTAGVHGCEYVGIEALNRLKRELEPAALSGRVILLPLVNPEGFYHGSKQTIPADGQNLNRMFPGKSDGTFSSQLARVLEETLYPEANFLMDLHGGDVNEALTPLVFFPASVPESLSATASASARALSIPYRVASTAKNGLYSWAAQCGIPALLVERGERGLWSEKEVAACRENVYELMRHLGILNAASVSPCLQQAEIRRAVYEEAPADGFWYPAVSAAGQKLKQGALLGALKDSYGNEIARYTAPFDGVVLYYTLSLGVKSGDPLIAYGKPSL
ncbi:M14 family metallopeptidase [Ventrimonas sp. CLA-AP-H27]|uniref:M14 family metallopeptidase n=1 Tax=Ventrimonas faecis TaxID=3133170 RepID=A0ABV1HMZ1_9FIRM